jgi:hypothetical protein
LFQNFLAKRGKYNFYLISYTFCEGEIAAFFY